MSRRRDGTLLSVVAITLFAIVVRVVGLGDRVAHWDEGRVAYWILDYGATGVIFYRPIVHGPLVQLVNAPIVDALGATDGVIRLFPAVVGGLLPLSALLFRHRLRDEAVLSLAALLALNPVLVYYSRFMRSDILTGAFAFVAFALLVRAIDFRDRRYLYPAALFLALSFGAKENALAYLLAWIGATVLLVDHRLFVARGLPDPWRRRLARTARRSRNALRTISEGGRDALADGVRRGGARLRRPVATAGVVATSFFLPLVYVYAPRGSLPSQSLYYNSCAGYDGYFDVAAAPTLGEAVANPLYFPRLFAFTVGSTAELYACQWITPRTEDPNPYLEFLAGMASVTVETSWPIVALAVIAFVVTRYRADLPDDLVAFTFYWGAASLVGYPFITDIGGAVWLLVHVVLPLTIPAAVTLGWLLAALREGIASGNVVDAVIAGFVVLVLVGSMAGTVYATSFQNTHSHENPLVQYAQPGSEDLRETLEEMEQLSGGGGVDVLLYGDELTGPTGGELDYRPNCSDWFTALPLPWYFEANDAVVDCATDEEELDAAADDRPPVVIVGEDDRAATDEQFADYRTETHLIRSFDTPVVFYVDDDRLEEN